MTRLRGSGPCGLTSLCGSIQDPSFPPPPQNKSHVDLVSFVQVESPVGHPFSPPSNSTRYRNTRKTESTGRLASFRELHLPVPSANLSLVKRAIWSVGLSTKWSDFGFFYPSHGAIR